MKYLTASTILSLLLVGVVSAQDEPKEAEATTTSLRAEVEICTAVVDHMPVGSDSSFAADIGSVCCWSRISGAETETTIKHVWMYDGKKMAVVDLPVRTQCWRTHSQKQILPEWTGEWQVDVMDAAGNTLKSVTFTIGVPAEPKTPQE